MEPKNFIKMSAVVLIMLYSGFLFQFIQDKCAPIEKVHSNNLSDSTISIPASFYEYMTNDDLNDIAYIFENQEEASLFCEQLHKIETEYNFSELTGDAVLIDKTLADLYRTGVYTEEWYSQHAYLLAFRIQLRRYMTADLYGTYDFPELNKTGSSSVLQPDDMRFRLISYDDLVGGSMRASESFIQFKNSSGKIIFEPFKSIFDPSIDRKKFAESSPYSGPLFYALNKIKKDKSYYLTMSIGKGSGLIYWDALDIFTFSEDKITFHKELYPADIMTQYESPSGLIFPLEFCHDSVYDPDLEYGIIYDSLSYSLMVRLPDSLPFHFKLK